MSWEFGKVGAAGLEQQSSAEGQGIPENASFLGWGTGGCKDADVRDTAKNQLLNSFGYNH